MSLSGLIIICVSIGFLVQLEAATFIALPNKNPDHPGKCWDSEHNVSWSIGESITVGECIRLTCHEDFSYSGASCSPRSVVVDGFECKDLPMDLSRNYPDCCPKLQCVGEDGQIIVF